MVEIFGGNKIDNEKKRNVSEVGRFAFVVKGLLGSRRY